MQVQHQLTAGLGDSKSINSVFECCARDASSPISCRPHWWHIRAKSSAMPSAPLLNAAPGTQKVGRS